MSIATLKKKTQAKYNNMSVGSTTGFSLNGGYRNQGFVGQTSLSRSLPKTLYRGDTPRGHGGCCGTYDVTTLVQSAVTSTEDHTVIKTSSMNTKGMILSKYRWIRRPLPFTSLKPDTTSNLNTSDDHTTIIRKQTLAAVDNCVGWANNRPPTNSDCNACSSILRRNYPCTINNVQNPITKPESTYVAMSQGEYLLQLDKFCVNLDIAFQEQQNTGTGCSNATIGC
jgi:hypothetical protein